MPTKIMLITGTRADWGLLKSTSTLLRDDTAFDLNIVATGTHLSEAYGLTVKEIIADGFDIDFEINILKDGNTEQAVVESLSAVISGVGRAIVESKPDTILVLGDRYEIFGAVTAALIHRIPVIHLCGGDITEGAIDDAMRHAISKMAHLHFVSNADALERLIAMGESPNSIVNVGNPSLDFLKDFVPVERPIFFDRLGLKEDRDLFLVTFHPTTLSEMTPLDQFTALCGALEEFTGDSSILITGANADVGGRDIAFMAENFSSKYENVEYSNSLGHELYFSALSHASVVIGNSSSGLYEAPSFDVPIVNIGNRQKGRLKASSVIDCDLSKGDIAQAIRKALSKDCHDTINPYGAGNAGVQIIQKLKEISFDFSLVQKRFYEADKK